VAIRSLLSPGPRQRAAYTLGMGPVGRVAELGEIDALLEAAAAGSGGVVTLVGPAGIGQDRAHRGGR
jgi:hypothetical protein